MRAERKRIKNIWGHNPLPVDRNFVLRSLDLLRRERFAWSVPANDGTGPFLFDSMWKLSGGSLYFVQSLDLVHPQSISIFIESLKSIKALSELCECKGRSVNAKVGRSVGYIQIRTSMGLVANHCDVAMALKGVGWFFRLTGYPRNNSSLSLISLELRAEICSSDRQTITKKVAP